MRKTLLFLFIAVILSGCAPAQNDLLFTGSVEADQVDISPKISGDIKSIAVHGGDTVKKDQILINLDTSDYSIKLEMAKIALSIAKLSQEDLDNGNSASLIKQAKANLESVNEQLNGILNELNYSKNDYDNTKALYDSGAVSQEQLNTAKRAVDKIQAQYDSLEKQRQGLAAALSSAQEGATSQTRSEAALQVNLRQLDIDDIQRTISKGAIYSPIDGVVQTVNYQTGEYVIPTNKVATIIDLSSLKVKIYVPEKQLYRVKLGMKAVFTDDFLNGKDVSGTVSYISPQAEFTPKNIESKESKQEMVYEVHIDINDQTGTIKPGMFLDVVLKEGQQ